MSNDSFSDGDSQGYSSGEERVHAQLFQHGNDLKCTLSKLFASQAEQNKELENLKTENRELKEKVRKPEKELGHEHYQNNAPDRRLLALKKELNEKELVLVDLEKKLKKRDELLLGLLERDRNADGNDDEVQEVMKDSTDDDGDDSVQEVMKDDAVDDAVKENADENDVQEVNKPIANTKCDAFKEALKQIVFKKSMSAKWKLLGLDDPLWQPFKTVSIAGSDEYEEILDLDNGRLAKLMFYMGDEADGILMSALNMALDSISSAGNSGD